ncbi:MAG: class I SAM-dependent DNA methyltransferase [Bacillota bacterium]|nr:class I SAM-dependent DNA methyltransferase [Bacillota bacterium]
MGNYSTFIKRLQDIMRNDAGINGDAQRIEQIAWMLFLKVYDVKENDWEFEESNYESFIPEKYRWRNWAANDESGNALTGDELLNFVNNEVFPTLKTLTVTKDTPIKKSIVQTTFQDANQYMKDGVLLRQVLNVIDSIDLTDNEDIHAFGEIYETILKDLQSAGNAGEFYTPRAVTEFMVSKIDPQIGDKMADFACGTGGFITSWLKALYPKVNSADDRAAYDQSIYGIEKKQFPYILCITNLLLHGIDMPKVIHGNSLTKNVLDYTEDDKFDKILMNPPYGGNEKDDVKSYFPEDIRSSETADLFMDVIMYRLKKNGKCAIVLPDGFLFGTDSAKTNIKKKLLTEFNLHTIVRLPQSVFAPYTSIATNLLFFDKAEPTKETWFYRLDMPEGYKHFSKTKPMKREHFVCCDEWWGNRVEIADEKSHDNATQTYKAKRYLIHELLTKNDKGEIAEINLDLCSYPVEEKVILSPEDTIKQFIEKRESLDDQMDLKLKKILNLLGVD